MNEYDYTVVFYQEGPGDEEYSVAALLMDPDGWLYAYHQVGVDADNGPDLDGLESEHVTLICDAEGIERSAPGAPVMIELAERLFALPEDARPQHWDRGSHSWAAAA